MCDQVTWRSIILACGLVAASHADTLRFRDGSSITGTWLGGPEGQIKFLVNGQIQTYPQSDVLDVTFISATPTAAQSSVALVEPDPPGVIYLQDPAGGLEPLERAQGYEVRVSSLYGTVPTWRVPGARSPVRVRTGDRPVFLVRLPSGADPHKYELIAFEVMGGERRTRPNMRTRSRPEAIQIYIAKAGESSYTLTLPPNLQRGEYSFSPRDSNDVFCFGIDPR